MELIKFDQRELELILRALHYFVECDIDEGSEDEMRDLMDKLDGFFEE